MPDTIKERVLALRDAQRPDIKSIRKLETTIGISNGALSSWDKSTPTAKNVQKVADFFNVSTDYILGKEHISTENDSTKETPDIKKMLDGALTYDGKPLSESDRDVVRMFLESLKSEG